MPEVVTKYDIVVTFLALLEMAKLKVIRVYQGGVHDTIRLRGTMDEVSEEEVSKLIQIENVEYGGKKEA